MPPAHDHPDTAEVVVDRAFAYLALALAALTIVAPALLAVLR